MPKVLYGKEQPLTGCSCSNNAVSAVIGISKRRKNDMIFC